MLLTVDAGNTNTKLAVFEGEKIIASFKMNTDSTRTSDEYGINLLNMLSSRKLDTGDIDAVIISSVVPDTMHSMINCMIKFLSVTPMIVGPGMKTGIKLVKTNPNEVGADRMADGVAALTMYGGPIIVADYGTATKFDYFSEEGVFESAITCPGIMLSARALWGGTAKLPEIEIKNPGTIMAKDTITSIQAGILYGRIGETEYIIDKLIAESGRPDMKVVATGGLAGNLFNETDRLQIWEPNLTMHGLRIMYEKNK